LKVIIVKEVIFSVEEKIESDNNFLNDSWLMK